MGGGSHWHTRKTDKVTDPEERGLLWTGSGSRGLKGHTVNPAARPGRRGRAEYVVTWNWSGVGEGVQAEGQVGARARSQHSTEQVR